MKRRRLVESLERAEPVSRRTKNKDTDHAGSPSAEASNDPAPTQHEPGEKGSAAILKSKYEPSEPFRAKKGDRFS